MNEPDAGVIFPQISMQDMTHKDMRNCLYINRKGRCQHYVHCRDRHCQTSHEAIIIAEDGQVVRKAFSFQNNCTGYNLLLEQVRRLTLVKSQIVFAMESTAHYWLALYARLLKDGYAVMVLNPIQSHSCGSFYIRKAKTDARDSLIIADLVRFGRCKASNVPQDRILALRELCRSRAYLVDMAADLKRKLIALLDRIFPEYESLFDSVFSKASIAVLSKYSTPQK